MIHMNPSRNKENEMMHFLASLLPGQRRKGRALTRCLRHSFVSSITRQFQRLSFCKQRTLNEHLKKSTCYKEIRAKFD
ncbi:Protein SEED AND ROOT HAIR PROTECTIVE PROTEIN [Dirofilaria immitis]